MMRIHESKCHKPRHKYGYDEVEELPPGEALRCEAEEHQKQERGGQHCIHCAAPHPSFNRNLYCRICRCAITADRVPRFGADLKTCDRPFRRASQVINLHLRRMRLQLDCKD